VKRPVPASWMFRDENRQKIKDEHFDGDNVKGSLVAEKAKELWESMSAIEKEPYETKYKEKWASYKEGNPSSTPTKPKVEFNFMENEEAEVPDGWDGPFENKYLHKFAVGYTVGTGRFATFEEAVKEAEKIENCGGITMDTGSRKGYTLRVSNDPQTDSRENPTGKFVSWTKKDFVMPKQEKKKKTKKEKMEKTPDMNDDENEDAYSDNSSMPELEPSEPSTKPEVSSTNSDDDSDDSDDDSDDDSEDDSDAEQLAVSVWTHQEKKYLVDEKNILYDFDTQDPLKKYRKYTPKNDSWKIKSIKE